MNEEKPTRPCPVCKAPMEETLQDYIVPVEDGDDLIVEDAYLAMRAVRLQRS